MRIFLWFDRRNPPGIVRGVESFLASRAVRVDSCKNADVILVLGGDGAFLHAAECAVEHDILLAGIPLGRLSFLYDTRREAWEDVLVRLLAGDFWVEERFLLVAEHKTQKKPFVNELVVTRGREVKPVLVKVWVDDEFLGEYHADGLVIATPTGSTAYALSLGGPILPPEAEGLLLVPIAPHLSLSNAIVLPSEARVRVEAVSRGEVVLSLDGKPAVTLREPVLVGSFERKLRVARFAGRDYFFSRLREVLRAQPVEEKLKQ